MLSYPYILFAL